MCNSITITHEILCMLIFRLVVMIIRVNIRIIMSNKLKEKGVDRCASREVNEDD